MDSAQATHHASQSRKAAASGWIGSALEYYDFFIYATAASLLSSRSSSSRRQPNRRNHRITGDLRCRLYRPAQSAPSSSGIGATPTAVRRCCSSACSSWVFSTMAVGILPTYQQVGHAGSGAARHPAPHPGLCGRGGDLRRQFDDSRTCTVRPARLLCKLYPPRGAGRAAPGGSGVPAACAFMPKDQFNSWGWRIPFLLSIVVIIAGYIIRREVDETPAFTEELAHGEVPASPVVEVLRLSWDDILRVLCMALTAVIAMVAATFGAAYAVQPAYGIGFPAGVYLWIPVLGNILRGDPHPLSSATSRTGLAAGRPAIVGALSAGLLSFAYLTRSASTTCGWRSSCRCLCGASPIRASTAYSRASSPNCSPRGCACPGWPSGRTSGRRSPRLLPALFVAVAPPGSTNIPLVVGAIAFGITVISALAALTARETYRLNIKDLGNPNAAPMSKADYDRKRTELAGSSVIATT